MKPTLPSAPAIIADASPSQLRQGSNKKFAEVFWVAFGYGLAAIGSMLSVRVFTTILTPAGYGQVALALSVAALAQQVGFAPIAQAATRFFAPADETGGLSSYFATCRRATLFVGVGIASAGVVLACTFYASGLLVALTLTTLLYVCAFGATSVIAGVQTAARQRRLVALHGAGGVWVRAALGAAAVVSFGPSSAAVIAGFGATYILVLLSQWRLFARDFAAELGGRGRRPRLQTAPTAAIIAYAWPFAAWGVLAWVQANMDRWIIAQNRSVQEVGMFQVVYQIGYQPMNLCLGFLVQLLMPVIFQRAGDATSGARLSLAHSLNRQAALAVFLLTAVAVLTSAVLHHQLIRIFATRDYYQVSYLIPILVAASGLAATAQVAGIRIMVALKTHVLLIAQTIPTVLGVIIVRFACQAYGLLGVAIADVLVAAMSLVAVLVVIKVAIARPVGFLDARSAARVPRAD